VPNDSEHPVWGTLYATGTLIQSAIDQANLRSTDVLKDGAGTLEGYYKTLSDGTRAWAEVRGGEITNGGINVIPG
jgi:hypothetical protein